MTESLALALAILSSSFFGSWHCAAMCTPIASLMSVKKQLAWYHLGRLFSYGLLGLGAGAAGEFFLESSLQWLRVCAALLLALTLFITGFKLIRPSRSLNFQFTKKMHAGLAFVQKKGGFAKMNSGLMVGVLTALLPCGWLYTYVLAAAVTRSPWAGALSMGLFWLGGLPALSVAPAMIRQGIASAGLAQQKIAGAVLITASLYSIFSFFILHSHA